MRPDADHTKPVITPGPSDKGQGPRMWSTLTECCWPSCLVGVLDLGK